MRDVITLETDLFAPGSVQPRIDHLSHGGEDFASWLVGALSPLREEGFAFSEPIPQDFGCGLWAVHRAGPFWVTLSCCGDGSPGNPVRWVVSVKDEPAFGSPLIHQPDPQVFVQLRDEIWHCVASTPGIRVLGSVH